MLLRTDLTEQPSRRMPLGASIYDVHFFWPTSPYLSKIYVLFVRNFGVFYEPPFPFCADVIYGSPFLESEANCAQIVSLHPVDLIPSYALPYAREWVREERRVRWPGKGSRVGENVFMRWWRPTNRGMLRTDGALAILSPLLNVKVV